MTVYEFGAKTRSDMDNSYCSDNFTYTWTHNNVMALEYVSSQLKDKQYDIIHCHDIFPAWIMNYFQGKLNIPVVVTMHASETDERRMEDPVRGFLCKTADVCIAVSNDLKNDLQKRYGINSIKVIHNGVNPSTIETETKKENYITYCGRLHGTKGVDTLIKAFDIVQTHDKYDNYRLKIIGEGNQYDRLKDLCKELSIEGNVDFVGKIENKKAREIIHGSRIHVIPSLYEPFATSALEAMEEKTAVVASEVGGLTEMIINGVTGYKVPPENVDELAEKIIFLLENDDVRREVEKNALKHVKQYEWSGIALQIYSEYEKLLEHNERKAV